MRTKALSVVVLVALVAAVPVTGAPTGDSTGAKVIGTIPVPNTGNVVSFAGSLWVTDNQTATLSRIDPTTKRVIASIPVGKGGTQLTGGAGSVWVANSDDSTVSRVDPATNSVVATIPVGANPQGITATPGAVWVASHDDGTVTKIEFTNPHAWLYVDVKEPDGKTTNWRFELGAPNALIRLGWRTDTIKAGTDVEITGFRAKAGGPVANGRSIKLPDGRELFSGGSAPQQ